MAVRAVRASSRRRLPPAVRGSAHHGLVLAAAALTVLLAATVLAALAALATGAVNAGAAARLDADARAEVQISALVRNGGRDAGQDGGFAAADRAVRAAAAVAFGDVPERTSAARYGLDPLAIATAPPGSAQAQLQLHPIAVQDAAVHARLDSGSWPTGAAAAPVAAITADRSDAAVGTVDAALPVSLARRLGARPGTVLVLADAARRTVRVRITGVYTATATQPGFWPGLVGDPLQGDLRAGSLLVVAPAAFTATPAFDQAVSARWTVLPDLSALDTARLPALRDRIAGFAASDTGRSVYLGRTPALPQLAVVSALPDAVDALSLPLVVARSALYQPTALLAVLALTALVLTARQPAEHRRIELMLRQVRGAGTGRLLLSAAGEWALVALPAGLAAPFLAGALLRLLHAAGLLALRPPDSTLGGAVRAAVAVTVLVHGLATLLPVLATVVGGGALARLRMRGARAALAQRVGADLALLAVAVLGYLQLAHYRTTVTGSAADGAADVDPVLVLVPAVATLAAALLLLRLLPLTSWALDRFGRRRRGLVLPLAAWQLSRRSARNAGPVVLMCLAVAVGGLADTVLAGLDGLAHDQAVFSVGADVGVDQVDPTDRPPEVMRAALAALPGVTGLTPVTSTGGSNADSDTDQVVGIDTRPLATAGSTPATAAPPTSTPNAPTPTPTPATAAPLLRADLAGPALPAELAALGARVPVHGLPLAGRPTSLLLDETLASDSDRSPPQLRVTLEDAAGLSSSVTVPLPAADGARHLVPVPLTGPADGGAVRSYPLTLTGLAVVMPTEQPRAVLTLTLHRIGSAAGWTGSPPAGTVWVDRTPAALESSSGGACLPSGGSVPEFGEGNPGLCSLRSGPDLLRLVFGTSEAAASQAGAQLEFGLAATGVAATTLPGPVPALADSAAVAEQQLVPGSVVRLTLDDGHLLSLRVTGTIAGVPGTDRGQGHFLVDQHALAAAEALLASTPEPATVWWLSSSDPDRTAAAVAADGGLGTARTVGAAQAALRADPFRSGMRAVLALCRLLAPAFAVVGFTVHAVIATRERRREFALLRAMGIRSRRLSALLWAEQLSVALFALVPGVLLGTGLAALVLPTVTVDDSGGPPFPPLLVHVPWLRVALTALVTAGVILLVVVGLARLLAKVDLVRVLRAGEGE
ncbi:MULTISPECIES: ABC transporter permease [Streptacidiphilus]|uniref:ABC transporter permease n=1 Tax=Streptacidiphilus cavernicola TaxID=3342716 RepID=A0ABV6UHJ9_9ACTN|nr:ABC transporter permease [Streptacidiphilus jeojiense]